MRAAIIGFVLGGILTVVALFVYRQVVIYRFADQFTYRFYNYVFDGSAFPGGHLEADLLVEHLCFPVHVAITYYDAAYHEVTRADTPGRYGAVVRIGFLGGFETNRFITLYRTSGKVFWGETPWPMTAQVPTQAGLDPAVVRAQEPQIIEMMKNGFVGDGDVSPDLAILLSGLSETAPGDPPAVERTNAVARDAAWWYGLRQQLGLVQKYPYLADLPRDYETDPGKKWPVILCLHSAEESGGNLARMRRFGIPMLIRQGRQVPAIVVTPACPSGEDWNPLILTQLLDEVMAKYRVDPDRLYATGGSSGGDGTWTLALFHPELLAAIVPICGESDPADTARLAKLPIWTFVGEKDDTSPSTETTDMVDGIRKAGGHPHLTILRNMGHGVWDTVWGMDDVYAWLLAQKKGQPEVLTPGVPP
jgi:pimeloyl-ACP methyl ester carboxylesterase